MKSFAVATALLLCGGQAAGGQPADIGGFGAGSDLTWSALATVNYNATDRLSFSAGYKVLGVDYNRNGHVYDTRLRGPVLGATWRF